MTLECYCDYDPPQVYSSRVVKARKRYSCYECHAAIEPGERHEYAFGVSDGWTYQPRTCASCLAIRNFVQLNIPCWCWGHGNLINDARDVVAEAYRHAPDEVRGVAFGLGRLIVKARNIRSAKSMAPLQ